jgi:predicted nucleotidyltransferase
MRLSKNIQSEIVNKITSLLDIDSIYIFGSYAREEENLDSDVDIYFVHNEQSADDIRLAAQAGVSLMRSFPELERDILCSSKDNFLLKASIPFTVENAVVNEGVKIYG